MEGILKRKTEEIISSLKEFSTDDCICILEVAKESITKKRVMEEINHTLKIIDKINETQKTRKSVKLPDNYSPMTGLIEKYKK